MDGVNVLKGMLFVITLGLLAMAVGYVSAWSLYHPHRPTVAFIREA